MRAAATHAQQTSAAANWTSAALHDRLHSVPENRRTRYIGHSTTQNHPLSYQSGAGRRSIEHSCGAARANTRSLHYRFRGQAEGVRKARVVSRTKPAGMGASCSTRAHTTGVVNLGLRNASAESCELGPRASSSSAVEFWTPGREVDLQLDAAAFRFAVCAGVQYADRVSRRQYKKLPHAYAVLVVVMEYE